FDKDDVEAAGLVKFDFLGLRTLTIIDRAVAIINGIRARAGEPPLNIDTLPMGDQKTYALLQSCRTTAVFQLESRGMKDLIRRLQPDCFEEFVALVALSRPAPLQSGIGETAPRARRCPRGSPASAAGSDPSCPATRVGRPRSYGRTAAARTSSDRPSAACRYSVAARRRGRGCR